MIRLSGAPAGCPAAGAPGTRSAGHEAVTAVRIGEPARRTGVSTRALRHYEQAGLLAPARADNGYRVYDEDAGIRVRNIRYLLDAGLTLEDVAFFLPCLDGDVAAAPPSAAGLRVARDRLAAMEARIAAQTAVRDRLRAALRSASAHEETSAHEGTSVHEETSVHEGGRTLVRAQSPGEGGGGEDGRGA